jgi:serine protease AprX
MLFVQFVQRSATALLVLLLVCTVDANANELHRYWVYFRDKNVPVVNMTQALNEAAQRLTPAGRERRLRAMPSLVDEYDLPVSVAYRAQVEQTGVDVRTASKWLNAVSIEATEEQAEQIRSLRCVRSVEAFHLCAVMDPWVPERALDDLHYGSSLVQNELCQVPELHSRGLSGQGIIVCILDAGARLDHQAFESLNIIGTRDFIYNDTIVSNQAGQDSAEQHYHGTATLSTMAGYRDSVLIGPAYGASVLVAKTEWVPSETPLEEDHYVAALEWADSLGARITSSSLGYIDWYTFQDLDGQTCTTTRAVNVAVSRGILVVTAAGNERGSNWGHLVAPADADSILAVGAVDAAGVVAYFSSPGPTADGRVKPDICAMGVGVFCANASSTHSYAYWNGTSLATPIVAGVAALIMQLHPDWTAQMVRTAILNTASNHPNPNNDYGWGIVNGVAAADYAFVPAAPTGLIILPSGQDVILSWQPISGAQGYNLYRSDVSTDSSFGTFVGSTAGTTLTDIGVVGTSPKLFYQVRAYRGGAASHSACPVRVAEGPAK